MRPGRRGDGGGRAVRGELRRARARHPGESLQTGVAPQLFTIETANCYKFRYGRPTSVSIVGPTVIHLFEDPRLDSRPLPPPRGYAVVKVQMQMTNDSGGGNSSPAPTAPAQPDCLPDGARRDDSQLPFCCHRENVTGPQSEHYCKP